MNFSPIVNVTLPELILAAVACVLMLLGVSGKASVRRAIPVLAIVALLGTFAYLTTNADFTGMALRDAAGAIRLHTFGWYIKLLTCGVGALLVLLAWPSDPDATGNKAIQYGHDAGEFFGLMLLSLAGVLLVAGANDVILLFLGIELASLPAYVMVSISRPVPAAQEAGVKYFFLGAMAAAILLFGFSYLYGTTGSTDLHAIAEHFRSSFANPVAGPAQMSSWELLAAVMIIAGLAFKLAAVPFHFYAGDVYQGAATPVTAFLSFVPKTSGMVALVKLLFVFGGGAFALPPELAKVIFAIAVLTMTVGNVLALVQAQNVKRVMAYSSVAHSGYMLAAAATICSAEANTAITEQGVTGILFYLTAYGIMNVAVFGVLVLLPSRTDAPATSAETFDDLAGTGRRHPALGIAMAIGCFSLTGIPLTVGFFGKYFIIKPALMLANDSSPAVSHSMYALAIIIVVNAAISAAYYLKVVAAMFLRAEPHIYHAPTGPQATVPHAPPHSSRFAFPTVLAVILSSAGTVLFGSVFPATQVLSTRVQQGSQIDDAVNATKFDDDETPATRPAAPALRAASTTPSAR